MSQTLWLYAVVVAGNVALTVAMIVAWVRNFEATKSFVRIGVAFALLFILFDMAVLTTLGAQAIDRPVGVIALLNAVSALRIYVFTVVGLLFAGRLNAYFGNTRYGAAVPTGRALAIAILAVAFMVGFSTLLFQLTGARLGTAFQDADTAATTVSPLLVLLVMAAAFGEEVIFRLGLQNGLTYWLRDSQFAHPIAVLVTTAFWCVMHVGALDPNWVKMVQVAVFGLVVGETNRRFGIIPCMIIHMLFNVVFVLMTPWVLTP